MIRRLALPLLLCSIGLAGCGADENGAALEVKVSAEQRAKDLHAEAESNIQWLEGLPPDRRQASVERAPQIRASLKDVSDPTLRKRIEALGIRL